jgi:hypothetical protein
MLKRTLMVLAILACALPLFARDWKPFVGVMGKLDFVTHGSNLNPSGWWIKWFDRTTEFDAGVRTGKHEVYFTYQFATSPERQYSSEQTSFGGSEVHVSSYIDSEWQSTKRILAGYRYWPSADGHWVVPVLGVATGYGWETFYRSSAANTAIVEFVSPIGFMTTDRRESHSYDERHSLADWEGLIEAGAAFRVIKGMDILTLAQAHTRFRHFTGEAGYTPFPHEGWINDGIFSCALQLRYTFEKPRF